MTIISTQRTLKLVGTSWLKNSIFTQDQSIPPKYLAIIKRNSNNSQESSQTPA